MFTRRTEESVTRTPHLSQVIPSYFFPRYFPQEHS